MKPDYTKQIIAREFKRLTKTTNITKITIKDIMTACQLNYGTFYYHFADKNDLIQWIIQTDIVDYFNDAKEGIWTNNSYRLLTIFQRDCAFYKQCLASNTQIDLRKILFDINYKTTKEYFNIQLGNRTISQEAKNFYLNYWSDAGTDVYIRYILNDAKTDPKKVLLYFYTVTEPYFKEMIESFIQNDKQEGMNPITNTHPNN